MSTYTGSISSSNVCPSCNGDNWKSARLVILEGTTKSTGQLSGEITQKGAFNGEIRDWFLSDRWFNYESPIEANLNSESYTALVDDIKAVLVDEGKKRPLPIYPSRKKPSQKPIQPTKKTRGFFSRKTIVPEKPDEVLRPQISPFEPSPFEKRSWFKNFKTALSFWITLSFLVFLAAIFVFDEVLYRFGEFFGFIESERSFVVRLDVLNNLQMALGGDGFLTITVLLIAFLVMFSFLAAFVFPFGRERRRLLSHNQLEANRRVAHEKRIAQAENDYNRQLAARQERLKERERKICQATEEEIEEKENERNYLLEKQAYKSEMVRYKQEVDQIEKEFSVAKADYDAAENDVLNFRAELWSRARVCMRCGKVYLGPREI